MPRGMELAPPSALLLQLARQMRRAIGERSASSAARVLGRRSAPDGTGILVVNTRLPR